VKAIVVGAGGTTRELLRRLGELWEVTVVDVDDAFLETASAIREITRVVGDGSSGLVLARAGLAEADALVAATDDDDVNLEAVRLAREAGLLRFAAVASDPERIQDYRDADVPVWAPDTLTARQIEVLLEPRRIASTTFADGKAEAIEFRISPDSPVRGKRLQQIHSDAWVVAAVLREGSLVIPKGATRLEAGDRVTVVGAATSFAQIVRTFTEGESRFPLNFGRKAAVALQSEHDLEGVVAEAVSLVRNSNAEALLVVHRDPESMSEQEEAAALGALLDRLRGQAEGVEVELRAVGGDLTEGLLEIARAESVGVVALTAPEGRRLWGRIKAARLINAYGGLGVPLLMARGRHPYSSIVVPARLTAAGESAGRAGIDLARNTAGTVTGVSAVSPAFVGSGDSVDDARRASAWLREEAAVQGVAVSRRLRRGNPVRILEEFSVSASLLVIAMPRLPLNPFVPGITGHLIPRVASSVLVVPPSP